MFYKRFISVLLALTLSMIGISVYADVDPSKVVVSYIEYEEITNYDEILQIAQAQSLTQVALPAVATPQPERIRVRQLDEDRLQADQLLSQTVYADGSTEEERLNSVRATVHRHKVNSQAIGNDVLYATSKIYYIYVTSAPSDPEQPAYAHYIEKGTTTMTYTPLSAPSTFSQNLSVLGMFGDILDYPATATHTNVPINSEVAVYYDSSCGYNLSAEIVVQLISTISVNGGPTYSFCHPYNGANDWPE